MIYKKPEIVNLKDIAYAIGVPALCFGGSNAYPTYCSPVGSMPSEVSCGVGTTPITWVGPTCDTVGNGYIGLCGTGGTP
ncbi:MAG TPA: hypothetical protein PL110_05760 [Candidatus Eremiobacteraeota bacterium]|nr:MAG: hypothetical protein BWY64_02463 [bacterium ADurb.Bin363]HPZ07599.1 hypothetical protein [Candidatus Eremiobacteraeota bacterium]